MEQDLKQLLNSEVQLKLSEQEFVIIIKRTVSKLKLNLYKNRVHKALI